MKLVKKTNLKRACIYILLLLGISCVYLDGIDYPESLTANTDATFTMDIRFHGNVSSDGEKLIIAILVPNSWETETTSTVTYTSSVDEGVQQMSLVPDSVLPVSGGGLTWGQHIKNTFGVGPNVLNDMKWVTFQSVKTYNVAQGEDITAQVSIKTKVGPKNLKAKLGFFLNRTNDGLGTDSASWKVMYSDCIEVTGGDGVTIDFCELHFNTAQPLAATKNDFVTFAFQGDISANPLNGSTSVYFCATAYTNTGGQYQVCSTSETSKMLRESDFGNNFSKTIWPAQYFSIPVNEELVRIEYSFKNADGTVEIKENDGNMFMYMFDCN